MNGLPVTITNAGVAVTPTIGGLPVTLVGGTGAAVSDGQVVTLDIDGVSKAATFTVVDGVITEIITA